MEIQIEIVGCALMLLSLIHTGFPRYFEWKKDLPHLGLFNRQMLQVHTFFIALFLFLVGLMCAVDAGQLLTTVLGRHICAGLSFFWLVRLYFQFFVYSPRLWKGKRFETAMHVVFSVFWGYLTLLFFFAFNIHNTPST